MAEAEDVLQDAARHATIFARDLWRRARKGKEPERLTLDDVKERLELLASAFAQRALPVRVAEPPTRPSTLTLLFRRDPGLRRREAVPATDGHRIWLPRQLAVESPREALERYRTLALQQAMRAVRGSAGLLEQASSPVVGALYLVLEADASDRALVRELPGSGVGIDALRRAARERRRPPDTRDPLHGLERFVQELESTSCTKAFEDLPALDDPRSALAAAEELAPKLVPRELWRKLGDAPLVLDAWTGELRPPSETRPRASTREGTPHDEQRRTRGEGRLKSTPRVREAEEDEDEQPMGALMVQSSEPNETLEDPFGVQRPVDRGEDMAQDLADELADLPEARLVTTPNAAKEVLLSDNAPEVERAPQSAAVESESIRVSYPEWDYRAAGYRWPGATVHLREGALGSPAWVKRTLEEHAHLSREIRRQLESLRPERTRWRRQLDGDDVDLAAYVEARADLRAGLTMSQALYETVRPARRSLAVSLLIDVSGSTDAWVTAQKRIIDVEKEALLLVCHALEGLKEPYAVLTFSGEGPGGVVVRSIKAFEQRFDESAARRIAALEPEHYTRAGAALRHATTLLMRQSAEHRLLLLVSDGKPNDIDEYDGRYGVEDMRQAVNEARLQGIFPFCLTVDRRAPSYLPQVFGPHQYALLQKPEELPVAMIGWLRRLLRE